MGLKSIHLYFLAFFFVIGMHFFMHNAGGSTLSLPFNMVHWMFVSVCIALGLWQISKTQNIRILPLLFWLIAGLAILCIPLLNPDDTWKLQALPRFIAIASMILLFFTLSQFHYELKYRESIIYIVLFGVIVEIIYGLVQFFFLKEGNWFGYDFMKNRPYGIFQKDSVFSSFIAVGITAALYLLQTVVISKQTYWRVVACLFVLLTGPFLLIQIQSRAGMYGVVLSSVILLPVLFMRQRKLSVMASVAVIIGICLGVFFFHQARTLGSYELTSSYRLMYWKHALTMLTQAPWLGHGYGSFEYSFLHDFYAPQNIHPGMTYMEENLDHPHNEVLFWLFEGGAVAIVGLLLMTVGYIWTLWTIPGWTKRLSLFALILPLLFHCFVEYPFYHSVVHFMVFIIFLWFAAEERGTVKNIACTHFFALKSIALLIPLIVIPFMATGLQELRILMDYEQSKDKNIMMLEKIINPLPQFMLYSFEIHSFQLTMALATHDRPALLGFAAWAEQFLHDTPRALVYAQLVSAYQSLGNESKAKQWLDEGKRIFPTEKYWTELDKITSSAQPH
jgi:O-antigen polymerase